MTEARPAVPAADSAAVSRYRRAVDYISAGQIYLKGHPLLEEPLKPEHIKDRLLGHWGTAPGINLLCAHLNLSQIRGRPPEKLGLRRRKREGKGR